MERFFNLLTLIIYWCIAIIWGVIFVFYINKINNLRSFKLLKLLLVILALDAFRSFFESVYFGSWFTSLSGYLPIAVYNYLSQPQMVIFPKFLNLITAVIVLILLIKKWLPLEIDENNKIAQIVKKQTSEIKEAYNELKKTEIVLKEKSKTLANTLNLNASLLENAGKGIYGLDLKGNATFINQKGADLLGYTKGELIGKEMHSNHHHHKVDGTVYYQSECFIQSSIKDCVSHNITNEVFWKKDGSPFQVEYTSTPILQEGKPIGAVVVFDDITERKKIMRELESLNINLEALVNERTKTLKEKNKKLDKLNKVFVGREIRMAALKEEIKKLKENT
ncbi:PAS domain S-box protein [uncultured Lutibacter sp.]|uniref:PAS domain-containing protein n=1 Tax=uncultured Lutibacter sp. TaxID=437739 RepID=UPI00260450F9|nr:PAS domain S-box protein [uncultured Lutibacter sp.]